jgi:peptidoglycan/xylan/chitin deacetylase (PgdA/CDA1 family)
MREGARHARAFVIRWSARLAARPRGVVLLYHGLADVAGNPSSEILPARAIATLEAHVRHLRRHYRLVPPSELLEATRSRRRGRRIPVALTFDDDLRSHVSHAAPLLRRLDVPAAFFLCGASLARPWRFWWEDLQAVLDSAALVPDALPGIRRETVGAALAGEKRAAKRLASEIEQLTAAARANVATVLRTVAGEVGPQAGLRGWEARVLADSGFEIGFHTRRHDGLPELGDEQLEAAFADGRAELETAVGRALTAVSYPHGRADERVAAAARSAGFRWGFAGGERAVAADDDPLLLPRVSAIADSSGAFAVEVARLISRRTAPAIAPGRARVAS